MNSVAQTLSHVLIIDDNLQHRRAVAALLIRFINNIRLSAYDAKQHPPLEARFPWQDYKLVIMDVDSDTENTKNWFRELSDAARLPPFIFLHTDCSTDDAVDFMRMGAVDYICKNQLEHKRFMKALKRLSGFMLDKPPSTVSGLINPGQIRAKPASRKKDTQSQTGGNKPAISMQDIKGGTKFGEYTVQACIGKGATAWVYRVTRKAGNKLMALKLCLPKVVNDPELRDRFIREFELTKDINHPHIVKMHELGVQNNSIYSVMELLPAGDLEQKISNKLSLKQVVNYTAQIAAALYEAHRQDIIHRDLKPANILFRDDGSLALIDFGIAKLIRGDNLIQTAAGIMVGTPAYVSPEQAMGDELDARTDLYTLGIIVYEMLEQRKPFAGLSAVDVMYAHVNSPPPRLSGHYGELNNIVMRLLEKEADNRYASGLELLQTLQQWYPDHFDKQLLRMSEGNPGKS